MPGSSEGSTLDFRLRAFVSMTARLLALAAWVIASPASAQATLVEDEGAKERLLGEHVFNLQWIDHPPGVAKVADRGGGELYLSAEQRDEKKGDYAVIKGRVLRITAKTFVIEGEVVTRVDHMAKGKACARSGTWTFRITGSRPYWRLKEMLNPCEGENTVDYLDVYFARPTAAK